MDLAYFVDLLDLRMWVMAIPLWFCYEHMHIYTYIYIYIYICLYIYVSVYVEVGSGHPLYMNSYTIYNI